jgi:4-hydroxybenzoate polyprenyltransferase
MTPSGDPCGRKDLKEFGIWISLLAFLVALFSASVIPVVIYAEFWMLSLPPIALGIIYFGGKILVRRYENVRASMTAGEKLDLQRRSEMSPGRLTKTNLTFVCLMLAVMVAMWLCGQHMLKRHSDIVTNKHQNLR